MIAQEMHIDLEQKVQMQGASGLFGFSSYQYDWLLSRGQRTFIKRSSKPKPYYNNNFQETIANYDKVKNLIKQVSLPAIVEDNSTVKFVLPDDYFMLVDDRSNSICKKLNTVTTTEYIAKFRITPEYMQNIAPNFFKGLGIDVLMNDLVTRHTLFNLNTQVGFENGVEDKEYLFYIINIIRDSFSSNLFKLYWESYLDVYEPNTFLIVYSRPATSSDFPILATQSLYTVGNPVPTIIKSFNFNTVRTITKYEETDLVPIVRSNRLVSNEVSNEVSTNSITGTNPNKPISELIGNNLYVYINNTFVVNSLNLIYIRRPKLISAVFSRNCEVLDTYHEEIVDITAKAITAGIPNEKFQTISANDTFDD